MSDSTCAKCPAALPDGGMVSSDGEVCQSCYDASEGASGFSIGALDSVAIGCAVVPFVFSVWVNGMGYVHIAAGGIGVAAGGFHAFKSVTSEFKNMQSAAIGGGAALLCAFHLLRGLGIV